MKKIIVRLVLIMLFLAAAGGGFWVYRTRAAAQGQAAASASLSQVVEVKQGNLSSSITVVGELDAVQREDLTFNRMNGTAPLLTLAVQAGNTVKAGQVVATIDPASYQQAVDQARSDLKTAEDKLAELKTPVTAEQIAQADLAVAKAQSDLENAKQSLADLQTADRTKLQNALRDAQDNLTLAQYSRDLAEHDSLAKSERDLQYAADWYGRRIIQLQELVASGKANLEQTNDLVKQQELLSSTQASLARTQAQRRLALESAALKVTKAEQAIADAQEALTTAQAGGDALALAKAQLAVQKAQVALVVAKEDRAELDAGPDQVAIAAAQATLDKRRLALSDAEAALAGCQLTAPFDGTVLRVNAAAGNLVSANTKLLNLANLKSLQVIANVDETTIRRVSAGQKAQVTFDALPGRTLRGEVQTVPLQGALQGGVTVYEVPITLTGATDLPLLVGMTANVQIQTGQVANALLVPAMAIQRSGGVYQVLVPNASDPAAPPQAVPVEVGLSDGVNTQIVKGLNVGDKVVVALASAQSNNNFRIGAGAGGAMFVTGGNQGGNQNRQPGR
jgi:HlyD family secretion protein